MLTPDADAATGRVFTGIDARSNGDGYLLSSARGEMYAFGGVGAVRNPAGSAGDIADVAVTADGRGAIAVSSAGQFYAHGTAKAQPNPTGFSGQIVGVALTADGQGAMAVSSAGQFYAYGTAKAQPNPTGFTGRIVGLDITADGRGALAMSSAGQFFAYGTAKAPPNPTNFTGEMADLALTGDGHGALAVSSSGQVYAYGAARYYGNGDPGCETYSGIQICRDIRARYLALGGLSGPLGRPTSGEFGVVNGGLGQHFTTGSIYWSAATGAWDVRGVIRDKYFSMAAERGVLGMPTTGEQFRNGHFGSHFANGSIYFSGATGTHEVHGLINGVYAGQNWADGTLELPLTDELAANGDWVGGRISFFTGGYVFWDGRSTTRTGTGSESDRRAAARSLQAASLDDFMAVQRTAAPSRYHLNWETDGCSGPTAGQVEEIFKDACIRHDFGNQNFGPKNDNLDPSAASLDRVNLTFLADMRLICAKLGNPPVKNGSAPAIPCDHAANTSYLAVYYTATRGAHWWR
jgi:hypothetical protein